MDIEYDTSDYYILDKSSLILNCPNKPISLWRLDGEYTNRIEPLKTSAGYILNNKDLFYIWEVTPESFLLLKYYNRDNLYTVYEELASSGKDISWYSEDLGFLNTENHSLELGEGPIVKIYSYYILDKKFNKRSNQNDNYMSDFVSINDMSQIINMFKQNQNRFKSYILSSTI